MKHLKFNLSFISILLLTNITITLCSKQTYIVHMDVTHKPSDQTHHSWYASHLNSLSIDPEKHLIYAYATVLHGFAAVLDSDHILRLRSHPSVLHLHPDPVLGLHTTRSPHFLGLLDPSIPSTSLPDAGAAVVVGVLDTGVWPESASFSDAGVPKPPEKWKGKCEEADDFSPRVCNKKLIGARSFSKGAVVAGAGENVSPRDTDGHGTHTASTAAGAAVTNASLFGYAAGTARGMAPGAHVATYKVCWKSGCFGSDILAGMETAIDDGVDVLSLSLGGGSTEYFHDTIAIGAFAAAEKGVFVACSAGNSGPRVGSLANTAPWIATVGAGTLDRDFPAHVSLGNGRHFTGVSLHSGKGMGAKPAPLVYFSGKNRSNLCLPGTVDPARAKGKVVFCDRGVNARVEKGAVVMAAGGVGMVLANAAANGEELVADSHLLPALAVGTTEGDLIREYARSDGNPTALIGFGGTVLGVKPSPVVAAFSSRGPNGVVPEILKPDLIGPGVNILAAWSRAVGPTGLRSDVRRTDFNIMSGTSMSCPHISGVAALLKAAHPDWSPAAIKSALITTAYTTSNTNSPLLDAAAGGGAPANPFAVGSGHVNPHKALDPGLIYDATPDNYLSFLCALRYNPDQIQTITKRPNITCKGQGRNPGNLNYPSFAVAFGRRRKVRYVREVTNVGEGSGVWSVRVEGVRGVRVTVRPRRIVFGGVGEKVKYKVMFESKKSGNSSVFGWISWSSGKYVVRSPVACSWSMFL